MENIELYFLTAALVLSFIAFGVATFKEFTKMSEEKYVDDGKSAGAKSFLNFLGSVFTEKSTK